MHFGRDTLDPVVREFDHSCQLTNVKFVTTKMHNHFIANDENFYEKLDYSHDSHVTLVPHSVYVFQCTENIIFIFKNWTTHGYTDIFNNNVKM